VIIVAFFEDDFSHAYHYGDEVVQKLEADSTNEKNK